MQRTGKGHSGTRALSIIDGFVVHISHTCRCEEVFYHIFTMISYSRLID